ncbi:ferritin family protein [Thermodesulfobacteriota bacterium]
MIELTHERKLGTTKGSEVEDAVMANFRGETAEVGLYLAMARQAYREGYPEVAQVLKQIAGEEADHAALFAELNGLISESTKENISKMLKGEVAANKGKRLSAVKAKEIACDPAHDVFDEASRDEGRHARALEGLLKRYFND